MNVQRRRASSLPQGTHLAWVVVLGAMACDNTMDDGPCGGQVAGQAKLAVWWGASPQTPETYGSGEIRVRDVPPEPDRTLNAEEKALSQLIGQYRQCNQVELATVNYDDKAQLKAALNGLDPNPDPAQIAELPDVVQLNAGETAFAYAPCLGLGSTRLAPIPGELWEQGEWGTLPDLKVLQANGLTPNGRRRAEGAVWYEMRDFFGETQMPGKAATQEPWIYEDRAAWIKQFIARDPNAVCGAAVTNDASSTATASTLTPVLQEPASSASLTGDPETYWMAPIAVHHINKLYFNITAVKDLLGLDASVDQAVVAKVFDTMSLADWLSNLEKWHAANPDVALLALPKEKSSAWALTLLAVENVKNALTKGPASHADVTDQEVAPEVMRIMDVLLSVAQQKEWTVAEAMQAVESGQAVFTVMGDWSYPDVNHTEVAMVSFPGTHNVFVYTIDGFVSLNKRQQAGAAGATPQANAWMKTISDRTVASDFAHSKGAISIHDWTKEVRKCAYEADKNLDDAGLPKPLDCMVVPALAMSNPGCDGAPVFWDWVNDPSADNRARVETALATGVCTAPASPPRVPTTIRAPRTTSFMSALGPSDTPEIEQTP